MIDLPPFDALALTLHHSPGVQAIILGSGLSRTAGIPTGWEITIDLIRRLAAIDGVTEQSDWPAWYQTKYSKEPSYSEILNALASTPDERRSILQSYIEAPADEEARQPTRAHHAIARLVRDGAIKVLITTNFDRLLESALRTSGIEPTVIAGEDAVAGATPLIHSRCTVIKVHGDYLDARIKNTDTELATYGPAIDGLLDQIFDNFGLITVGWSGDWDLALRSALLRAPSRRYPSYWATRGETSPLANEIIHHRGVRVIPITGADEFFERLENTVAALRSASSPHPQTIGASLALAKRLCRDDRFGMEWSDFLHTEVMTFRDYVLGPSYPTGIPTNESLTALLRTLTAKSEVLRRSAMICGRWGTEDANRTLRRALSTLSISEADRGGYVYLTEMRKFAASISFYWALAGLIESDRWTDVRKTMAAEIFEGSKSRSAVSVLPFSAYDRMDWNFIVGLERNHTPISDFLVELFKNEASAELAMTSQQAEDYFDVIEINVSLEFSYHRIEEMKTNKDFLSFWMPIGRFIWRRGRTTLEARLQAIEAMSPASPYFTAGMLGGSAQAATGTIVAIRDFQSRIASKFW